MKVLVWGVKMYSFPNDQGELIEGVKVNYFDLENQENNKNKKGLAESTISVKDLSMFDKFGKVPAMYDVEFLVVPGSKGKPTLKFKDAKFIKDYSFTY